MNVDPFDSGELPLDVNTVDNESFQSMDGHGRGDDGYDVREWIDVIMYIYLVIMLGILNIMLIQRAMECVFLADLTSADNQAKTEASQRKLQRQRDRNRKESYAVDRKQRQQPLKIITEEGVVAVAQVPKTDEKVKVKKAGLMVPINLFDLTGSFKLERKVGFQGKIAQMGEKMSSLLICYFTKVPSSNASLCAPLTLLCISFLLYLKEFLASQGVGWALRKAADKASPTNKITHDMEKHHVTIGVEGIISSSTTYKVNGPPIETKIQTKSFMDTMQYLETGDGVVVTKQNKEDGYYITVQRQVTSNKQEMTITSTAIWPDKKVQSIQYFSRIK
jgi:hypothetical protein